MITPEPSALILMYAPEGTGEGRPPADGDADRLVVGQLLPVAGHLGRGRDALLQADRQVDLPRRALVAGVDAGCAAELDRVHPDRRGDLVGVLLERPAGLRRRGRPHRAGRLVVGVDAVRVDVRALGLVRPGTCIAASCEKNADVGGVGAVVDDQEAAARGDGAVVA